MPTLLRPRLSYQPSSNEDLVLIWLRYAAYSREQDTPAYKGNHGWHPLWKTISHVIKVPVNCGDDITNELHNSLGVPVEEIITCRWVSGRSQPRSTGCRAHRKCLPWRRPPCGVYISHQLEDIIIRSQLPKNFSARGRPNLNHSSGLYHKD